MGVPDGLHLLAGLRNQLDQAICQDDWQKTCEAAIAISTVCQTRAGGEHPVAEIIRFVDDALHLAKPPGELPASLSGHQELFRIRDDIMVIRDAIFALARGDLSKTIQLKGYFGGVLKTLQAHLTHLTWQTQMVAKGDFSQRVDYMGEFSEAFNSMVAQLGEGHGKLKESEELFRALADSARAGIFILRDLRFVVVNRALTDILGYSEEELLNSDFPQFVHPEHRGMVKARVIARQRRNQAPLRYEMEVITKQGTTRWIEVTAGRVVYRGRPSTTGTVYDITERKQIEMALSESQRRYEQLAEQSRTITWEVDRHGMYTYISPVIEQVLGYHPTEIVGRKHFYDLCPQEEQQASKEFWLSVIQRSETLAHFENRMIAKDGRILWMLSSGVPIPAEGNELLGFRGSDTDITDRKQAEARIFHMAHHDALTDLPNRTLFFDRVQQAIKLAQRNGTQAALMLIDLDHFKPVNDTHGHEVGDQILCEAARRIRGRLRASDTAGRIGGDEFVILLSEVGSVDDAVRVAEAVRSELHRPFDLAELTLRISSSIGISLYPAHGAGTNLLLKCADVAMYSVKKSGGNGVRIFKQDFDS